MTEDFKRYNILAECPLCKKPLGYYDTNDTMTSGIDLLCVHCYNKLNKK